jgi:hypothetical protein
MDAAATIAMIRDLVFIIASGFLIILLLLGLIFAWSIYRTLKRTANKLERTSEVLMEAAAEPINIFGIAKNLVERGLGLLNKKR